MGYRFLMECDVCGLQLPGYTSTWTDVAELGALLIADAEKALATGCAGTCGPKLYCPACKHNAPTGPHPSHEVH